jgi:hypothetical protein
MPKNSGASDDFGRGAKAKAAKAESAAAKAAVRTGMWRLCVM